MDRVKEKFVNLYIDSLTDEEQKKEFGMAKKDVVAMELKFIKQMRFKAKAQLGRIKVENAIMQSLLFPLAERKVMIYFQKANIKTLTSVVKAISIETI